MKPCTVEEVAAMEKAHTEASVNDEEMFPGWDPVCWECAEQLTPAPCDVLRLIATIHEMEDQSRGYFQGEPRG